MEIRQRVAKVRTSDVLTLFHILRYLLDNSNPLDYY